jgi:cell division protein FtsB
MITLVVIIYDVCSLIKQNVDCRFRIIYQLMRKDALILRRFRADGEVHPIEKNKKKELTEEEMAERKKLEAEEEQRRAEFDNDEDENEGPIEERQRRQHGLLRLDDERIPGAEVR